MRKNVLMSENKKPRSPKEVERPPFLQCCFSYLMYHILILLCYVKEKAFMINSHKENNREGYAPLFSPADRLFSHHIYPRVSDCISRPTSSLACNKITVMERKKNNGQKWELTGNSAECINLASFNYLGLSQNTGPSIDETEQSIRHLTGLVSASTRRELGRTSLHDEVERLTADFLGAEAAVSFGMGFATNAMNLPTIITKGCLVISDKNNHASMILGLKLCNATVRVFQHNDMESLEAQLIDGIINGQPGSRAPWKKIFIVTEGIFSMEGSIVNLPEIIALKKKYKAYLYIDEAHSIGVLGRNGKGVTEYFGCDPKEIDIWMGTYSKSFAAFGGFITGSKSLINFLKVSSQGSYYSSPLPVAVIPKIIVSLKMCMGLLEETEEARNRIGRLKRNTNYFRAKLTQMGIVVCGDPDSPIVPIIFYFMSKLVATSRILIQRYNIAAATVGYPAVGVFGSRLRICLSAAHSKEEIDYTLNAIQEISNTLKLSYSKLPTTNDPIEY